MPKIGFYQFQPEFGNVRDNLARITAALGRADADLIVLPELPLTGYYFQDRNELVSLAEDPSSSATVESLIELCRQGDFHLVTGFAEKSADKFYNSSLLLGPEGIIAVYRKIHLFDTEKDCFDKGDLPLAVVEVRGINVGMMICFDWVFPEVARTLALKGADVICHPANLVLTYCQQAMLTRATENMVFVVTANRHGTERRPHGQLTFTGQSQIVAPRGKLLHRGSPDQDELYIADVDIALARNKSITDRSNLFDDRRPEFYSPGE